MANGANTFVNRKKGPFEKFSIRVSRATGTTAAFVSAVAFVVLWAIAGPFLDFSETWQLFINTGTTIVTFLMVFIIQRAQNKDSLAVNLKLNELVAAHELSSNRLISVEDLTEEELQLLHRYYLRLAEMSKQSAHLQESHSIEEAEAWHNKKSGHKPEKKSNANKNNDSSQ